MMVNSNDSGDKSPSSGMREYKCEVTGCCYRTNRAYNLWRHERSRHSEESERKLHQCMFCIYSTNKATNLKRHIGTRHPEYNMEEASKTSIVSKSSLTRCDFPGCKYITNRPYDMRRHMSVHCHQEKDHKKFKCSLCLYSSDRKANLHRHVEVRHAWRQLSLSLQEMKKGQVEDYEGEEELEEELEYHTLDDLIEEVELTLSEQEPDPEPEALSKDMEFEIKQESPNSKEQNHKKFKCNLCRYSSDRKSNLHRHVEVRHAFQRLNRSLLKIKTPQSQKEELNYEPKEELEYETLDDLIEVEVIQSEPEAETEPQIEELVEVDFVDIEPVKVPEAQPKIKPVIKANTSTVWQLPPLEGNSKDKQVIAINVNGELRWFQSIQPPEGATSELERVMQMQDQAPQIVQQVIENDLHNEEYEVISLNKVEEEEEFEEEFVDDYDQEEREGEHHVYNIEMVDERQETQAPQALTHSTPLATRAQQENFVLTKKSVKSNDWTWTTSNVSSPDPETYTINTYLTS